MKPFIFKKHCSNCGEQYDSTISKCPKCGEENEALRGKDIFENDIHVHPLQNLGLFLMGLMGFQLIGTIIISIIQSGFVRDFMASNPNADRAALVQAWADYYKSTPGVGMLVNGLGYVIVAICLFLILWKGIKEFGKSFTKWQNIAYGALGGIALITLSILLGNIMTAIRPETTTNENQQALVTITTGGYAAYALIIFGIVGPICEELTYRVGLFTLAKRFNHVLAYIVTALVFGLIHFNWAAFGAGDSALLINELLNLPDYVLAGLIMCTLYDKCGFAASATAHIVNNCVSLGFMLLAQ